MIDNKLLLTLKSFLENNSFIKMTLSNPFNKNEKYFKIIIEKKFMKNENCFQIIYYYETKVKHENFKNTEQLFESLIKVPASGYKQLHISLSEESVQILVNKNGSFKINRTKTLYNIKNINEHNEIKNYIIKEGEVLPWLVKLNITNPNGKVFDKMQKKFRQINKFLEIISNILQSIPQNANILDIGCGKSYLTFALYHYLNLLQNKNAKILGIDIKTDVIEYCRALAEELTYSELTFESGDISKYVSDNNIDMIISLHACDTATDYAIAAGIKTKAKIIISVPCCQHELFSQVKSPLLGSMLKHGILKEKFSSLLTDSLRGTLLEAYGYKTDIIEFIDLEHTPKNIMIIAVKNEFSNKNDKALAESLKIMDAFSIKPKLYELLTD